MGKNTKAPQVPCHRVVRSNEELGKYSGPGGIQQKIDLLKSEGVEVKNRKIVNFAGICHYFS